MKRQRKRWEDNIREWTGLEWNIILRKAESREEWRKLVVKSTVVPQRSARLRDRSDKIRPSGQSDYGTGVGEGEEASHTLQHQNLRQDKLYPELHEAQIVACSRGQPKDLIDTR